MLSFVLIALFIIFIAAGLVWLAEVQSTITFVLDKGGLWLDYSTGVGRLRLVGFQIRIMTGHKPRAWMRRAHTRKLHLVEFDKTIGSVTEKKWKPINLTFGSALDIGIKIIIRELKVNAKIGIEGDAAATALLCGSISSALQLIRIASTRGEFVPKGFVEITPVFDRARLSIRFKCILAIKARHIIREVIENIARRIRDGQSSNRKYHANNNGKHTQYGGR